MEVFVGITDHLDNEVTAMLQAMYSRSYASIVTRLPETKETNDSLKERLAKYYVSWGHKSVGQLGSTTVWIEGVSQLAAKAIENNKLFNGQESSTRYIDFSTQPFAVSNEDQRYWQEKFRNFYIKVQPHLIDQLKVTELSYANSIKARSFDILRGLLPAGATTNVVFTGTFDTLNDHFGAMLYHPLEECRTIAKKVLAGLIKEYPYATIPMEKLSKTFEYLNSDHFYEESYIDFISNKYTDLLVRDPYTVTHYRNKFEKLPNGVSVTNTSTFYSTLDFGSFRDLHRHRNGNLNMPCLTTEFGFHSYYLDNLPDAFKQELATLIVDFEYYIEANKEHAFDKQYMIPMGYKVPFSYTSDLNQTMYILELRSAKTVHQTLRQEIMIWYKQFKRAFPNVSIHIDTTEDNWSLKRGTQTFSGDFK
jgi:thymidylate synthase ThyX